MKIKITNYKVSLSKKDNPLINLISKDFRINKANIHNIYVEKESVDARHKQNIYISYNLIVDIDDFIFEKIKNNVNVSIYNDEKIVLDYPVWEEKNRPVVVGFGPAGIFAALYLTRCKANPIILERGSDMDSGCRTDCHLPELCQMVQEA
jgi:uncharacterized FAD-dependent dehydrogenase